VLAAAAWIASDKAFGLGFGIQMHKRDLHDYKKKVRGGHGARHAALFCSALAPYPCLMRRSGFGCFRH
jgi:hypothetical protein